MYGDEIQRQLDEVRKRALQRLQAGDKSQITYLRIASKFRARQLSFEDCLSSEDRQLLHSMGIAV